MFISISVLFIQFSLRAVFEFQLSVVYDCGHVFRLSSDWLVWGFGAATVLSTARICSPNLSSVCSSAAHLFSVSRHVEWSARGSGGSEADGEWESQQLHPHNLHLHTAAPQQGGQFGSVSIRLSRILLELLEPKSWLKNASNIQPGMWKCVSSSFLSFWL